MKVEDQQLKLFISDADIVPKEQLEEASKEAKKTKKKLEDVLLEKKLIDSTKLIQLKAYILGIPFIDLKKQKIDLEILNSIPETIARKNNVVAYKKNGNELEVAMLDPRDLQTLEFIRKKTSLTILPRLTDEESVKQVLLQYEKSLEAEFGDYIKKDSDELKIVKELSESAEGGGDDLEKVAEDVPIIKIVDALVKHAILQGASDIHIEPAEKELIVRYRIDGILHDEMVLPKKVQPGVVARIKVLASLKLDEHRLPQDGRFKIETVDYKVSFRVSVLPVFDGEKIVARLLFESGKTFGLKELGFHGDRLDVLQRNISKPVGMILVTGPTGSGKTTTLYTIVSLLNNSEVNISTVEDPVEYRMPRVNQTQVNPKIGLTFANGLRSLLRQDPDIIMVGEIRDEETAALAVNAALTGHQVLSTLHTNSAAGAIPRLIDMNVEPFLISSTINIIIAQRLVRALSKNKEKYTLTKDAIKDFSKEFDMDKVLNILKREKIIEKSDDWTDINFYRPIPSTDSTDGYKGRLGIHEVLEVSVPIKELIVKRSSIDEITAQARKEGMVTMLEDGFIKAVEGLTSIEEILRVTKE